MALSAEPLRLLDPFAVPLTLVESGGPRPSEYALLHAWLEAGARWITEGQLTFDTVIAFWRALGPDYLAGSLQGRALAKPHGYPGDFEIMDDIYSRRVSSDPRFHKWDVFFQRQPSPAAVRNRAPYLATCLRLAAARQTRPLRLLDLGCGPARHLAPFLLGPAGSG